MANLVQKRAGNRGCVTKLLTKIKAIIDDGTLDVGKIHDLGKKIADLHSRLKTVRELDEDIQNGLPADELEEEIENADTFNGNAKDAQDYAEFVLDQLQQEEMQHNAPPPPPILPVPPNIGGNNNPTVPQFSHLPKFELPEFNSDILSWQSFWDVFESEVHNKAHYSVATKFMYLNSRLQGEAKELLAGLAPNNANYPKAIDLLQERYGQPKKVISAHTCEHYFIFQSRGMIDQA